MQQAGKFGLDLADWVAIWYAFLWNAIFSPDPHIQAALKASAGFYETWHLEGCDFDTWWKGHSHLFDDKGTGVRLLKSGDRLPDPETSALLVIPRTPTLSKTTFDDVKAILKREFAESGRRIHEQRYGLSEGSQARPGPLIETFFVHSAALEYPGLRGEALLHAIYPALEGEKTRPEWLRIDFDKDEHDEKNTILRNLRRTIAKGDQILMNVAHGIFPGNFDDRSS